ncbi:hypothetical protein BU14_0329s0013 [Porphyra umbilicalis]|uniref:Uncharacterized protein n=1 Tax=Porphyra umbilicalis TaxID=2786 RepID=A0A1X6NYX9_PORUM|nr:hypothetical protein BU14_0329s0013 [Porphyra umbilicalis]|eukprot:OSX73745.1 hypothetical protein BU14_0329s0013 [Porphyra umbilicalis]
MVANKVPAAIARFAAATGAGKFTFQAGRNDRATNLVAGLLVFGVCAQAVRGAHQLLLDYGKKDGF